MAQGMYHYISEAWKKPSRELLYDRLIKWRAGEAVERVDKPLRLDRARALGYKAKKGFIILRVRIIRGGRRRERKKVKGRKSTRQTVRKTLKMSYQWVAEVRAARKYPDLEVLNSYWIGKDGQHYYFEIIMVDPKRPEILSDKNINWIAKNSSRNRAERGLTSSAKKSRGLLNKSRNLKIRPSLRSWNRKGK